MRTSSEVKKTRWYSSFTRLRNAVRSSNFETSINWKNAFLRYSINVLLVLVTIPGEIYFLYLLPADNYLTETYVQIVNQLVTSSRFYELFSKVSIALTFSWTFSEVIVLLFNKKKRAIHDYIAGTVVICIEKQL